MRSKFVRFSPEWWEWMTMPEPNTGCLLWMGCACAKGYGRISTSHKGSPVLVHRIAYAQAYGPLDGRHVCHRCDTPSCVNPDHLFIGTQEDNMRDMFAKGRARPAGRGRPVLRFARTVAATVAVRELASTDSNERVRIDSRVHLPRNSAMVAGWRHVTGVPAWAKDHDGPTCRIPRLSSLEPANRDGVGLGTVATLAPNCASRPSAGGRQP